MSEKWVCSSSSNRHDVSDLGRIRVRDTGKIIKSRPDKDGYRIASLWVDNKYITIRVHREVYSSFYGCISEKEIDHIDKNRSNNLLSNLRVLSRTEQVRMVRRNPASGHRGVRQSSNGKRWVAFGVENKRYTHIKTCDTKTLAIEARLEWEREQPWLHIHASEHLAPTGG